MIILTSTASGTYKAQIRSDLSKGFKQLYTATSTESEFAAARSVVRKWFGESAVLSIQHIKDGSEINALVGDFFKDPNRKQVFEVYTFDSQVKPRSSSFPLPPSKAAKEITTEVVTPREAVLSDASKALEKLRKIVVKHEESFAAITLGPRLQIGLQCLKAHHVFSLPDPGKRGQGRKKNQLTRELISTNGLKGWLATECQWLKEPTAYKYMNAVRGLGLDHGATEKEVASALKIQLRKGPVTIKSLCDAAIEAIAPPAEEEPRHEQQEFDLLKQTLTSFREETETLLNSKEKLDAYPDFKRAAVARLYGALHDLTGTHWKPSDEPDALALVDPDSITL